ncbi:MAG: FixH family protein [Proteobacteria bacterium]|nr:hypothetical protein [Pseudomonadota bacterium]NOG61596.1 FixH family protein [Pseudomonadota bacterium]
MNPVNNENKPWHKEHYVWMIIFFPMLAIVGGIITTILAVQSNDGLVVDDYYKEGLEINRTLERDKLALAYKLNADITLNEELGEVVIVLKADDEFVYPEYLSVTFLHSTRAGLDEEVNMMLTEKSTYRGHLSKLVKGKWYVYIQRDSWRLIKTVIVTK